MRAGQLRVSYWAVGEDGKRAELLLSVEQDASGHHPEVLCTDPRPIEAILEMRHGESWLAVRTRRVESSVSPRCLPTP